MRSHLQHTVWGVPELSGGSSDEDRPLPNHIVIRSPLESCASSSDGEGHDGAVSPVGGVQRRSSGSSMECTHPELQQLASQQPDVASSSFDAPLPQGVTTLIISNLSVNMEQLLELWSPVEDAFDMIYIPCSKRRRKASSYAFVNFLSNEDAIAFREKWHNKRIGAHSSGRACVVRPAKLQGVRANLFYFKRNGFEETANKANMPVLFDGPAKLDLLSVLRDIECV